MEMYSLILPNIVQKKGRNFKVALLLADSIKNVVNLFSSYFYVISLDIIKFGYSKEVDYAKNRKLLSSSSL